MLFVSSCSNDRVTKDRINCYHRSTAEDIERFGLNTTQTIKLNGHAISATINATRHPCLPRSLASQNTHIKDAKNTVSENNPKQPANTSSNHILVAPLFPGELQSTIGRRSGASARPSAYLSMLSQEETKKKPLVGLACGYGAAWRSSGNIAFRIFQRGR